jgi:glyoxylase-like metal-dependent hydrolase (beta-lactamase superfamily II)/rhodanese-related sulfurtransferase
MYGRSSKNNQEITPNDLKRKIDNNEDIFLLDVRTPQEYNFWKISYDNHENPKLIPIDHLFGNASNLLKDIPKDKEIVTVCAHGNRSLMAAKLLGQFGYNAKSVSGGMAGWNKVTDVAEIPVPTKSPFQIWQLRRVSKGCMGYIISSKENKNTIVIDPSREINEYFLKVAKDNGLKITKIIDTHQHADHISGVSRLARIKEAEINSNESLACFSSYEEYDHSTTDLNNINYLKDGDEIHIDQNFSLKAIHTPGHTNGSISFVIEYEKTDNNMSMNNYLFTGDTLFVDGIGRPDLRDQASLFAGILYDTYHQKILQFSENTIILPAHFNGSSIILKHEVPIYETIGSITKKIKLLSMTKDEFIKFIIDTLPARPINYKQITAINKKMISFDEIEMPDLESGPNSCAISQ